MNDAWELLAQWPGGTIAALSTARGTTATGDNGSARLALAATAAGLHTSDDGGRTWRWVALGADPVPETLVAAPSFATTQTVLMGAGSGLYRSFDGGTSWRPVLVGSRVQALAAAGDFTAGGVILAGTADDGILRSDDGGLGWDGANAGLLDMNVTALALSPSFDQDRTAFAGTTTGLYRSRNGGRAWRLVELGPDAPAIQALAVSPTFPDDGLVLAGTEADGLFRSDDSGQTWQPVAAFPEPCVTSLLCVGQPDDQREGRTMIAAGTAAGVALSADGGRTWRLEAPELGPILSLAVASGALGEDTALLAGTIDAGVRRPLAGPTAAEATSVTDGARTEDAGASAGWTLANTGLVGRATVGLSVSMGYGDEPLITVAMLDGGAHLSHDAGRSWKTGQIGLTDGAASTLAMVRRQDGQPRLLAPFTDGLFRSSDIEGGWEPVAVSPNAGARPTFVQTVGDHGGGSSLAVAAGGSLLAVSYDGGDTWATLPPPKPRADIVGAAASPDLARDGTLYAVVRATVTQKDGTATPDGLELWQTDSLGRSWSRWLHAPDATVMPLAVARPGDLDASLLVGRPGRISRPQPRAQERSHGEKRPLWREARIGGPLATVTALAVSPRVRTDRTILAAADDGVYLSRDGGQSFAAFDDGLAVPLVTALALVARGDGELTAYALGLGGTLWQRRL